MSSVYRCVVYHSIVTACSPSSSSPYSDTLEGWRGVDRGMVPRSEDAMARKQTDPSADIMARLNATGLLPALAAAKVTSRVTGGLRNTVKPRSVTVVKPPVTMSPELSRTISVDPRMYPSGGGQLSYETTPGRNTIERGVVYRSVHISFPEWV
jgi:hypothetical protein